MFLYQFLITSVSLTEATPQSALLNPLTPFGEIDPQFLSNHAHSSGLADACRTGYEQNALLSIDIQHDELTLYFRNRSRVVCDTVGVEAPTASGTP